MDALLGRGMAAEVLAVGAGAVSSVTGRTYDVLIVNQEAKSFFQKFPPTVFDKDQTLRVRTRNPPQLFSPQ